MKKEKILKKDNTVRKKNGNQMFVCTKCNRVFEIYKYTIHAGLFKIKIFYRDGFSRLGLEKKECNECIKKEEKECTEC